MKYNINDIDDYQNRLDEEQKSKLIKHCNKYEIAPNICAWYDNLEDFYSDWCKIGYTKKQAKELLNNNIENEFIKFSNGEIIRLVV